MLLLWSMVNLLLGVHSLCGPERACRHLIQGRVRGSTWEVMHAPLSAGIRATVLGEELSQMRRHLVLLRQCAEHTRRSARHYTLIWRRAPMLSCMSCQESASTGSGEPQPSHLLLMSSDLPVLCVPCTGCLSQVCVPVCCIFLSSKKVDMYNV